MTTSPEKKPDVDEEVEVEEAHEKTESPEKAPSDDETEEPVPASKKRAPASKKSKTTNKKNKEEKPAKTSKKTEKKSTSKTENSSNGETPKSKHESMDAFAVKTPTATPEVTPSQGKKRRRKRTLVTKSFVDDDGFMGKENRRCCKFYQFSVNIKFVWILK